MSKPLKSEEIKVRVEPSKKLALEEIAQRDGLDLSDIVRRALTEMINRRTSGELRSAS